MDSYYFLSLYLLDFSVKILTGIVAQMVERLLSMQEAAGSMPACSIFFFIEKKCIIIYIGTYISYSKYNIYIIIIFFSCIFIIDILFSILFLIIIYSKT